MITRRWILRLAHSMMLVAAGIACAATAARTEDVAAPEPIRRALAAVDLTPAQFRLDRHDLSLYGGDRWRLRLFDALVERPLRIPGDVEVLQRNLLRDCERPSALHAAAAARIETGVRRGLIGNPVDEIRKSLPESDPLPHALRNLWRESGRALSSKDAKRIAADTARLSDSLAVPLALILQAATRVRAKGPRTAEHASLGRDAIAYLIGSNDDAPDPAFQRRVEAHADGIDYRVWNAAIQDLLLTIEAALPALRRHTASIPAAGWRIETPIGDLALAGSDADTHEGAAPFFLLDAGGDDRYASGAAATFDRPVSILIDLDGDDTYNAGVDTLGPSFGAGILGVGILIDEKGTDRYHGGHLSLGAGFYGVGILMDRAGDDRYQALTAAQGAGLFGIGILCDLDGDDAYHAFQQAQGYGYVRGAGLLIDRSGDDSYVADDEQIRYPSSQAKDHNASLAQGFGFGKRADYLDGHSLAGGIGILADGDGNDSYRCGVFGQGCAYWYGIGILADGSGNDQYEGVWYTQGSAAHFALGVLWEGGGDDRYHATHNMAIGAGHDLSIGLLYDRSGDDRYAAPNLSLGGGNANGIGWFWDVAGNDTYEVEAGTTLGRANVASRGGLRDRLETIGIFIDTGGDDAYPSLKEFAGNNRIWTQTGLDEERPLDTERGAGIDTDWSEADVPTWRTRRSQP